jgi:MarR family transcriptional regulator, organic hydroperoxide resistance regulator
MSDEQLEDNISVILAQLNREHRKRVDALLSDFGLHVGQDVLLLNVSEADGCTQNEIAECLNIQPATVTRMLQRIEKTGLIERRKDATDNRITRVYLTEAGRQQEQRLTALWKTVEADLVQGMTPAEQALLRRMLLQMVHNITS